MVLDIFRGLRDALGVEKALMLLAAQNENLRMVFMILVSEGYQPYTTKSLLGTSLHICGEARREAVLKAFDISKRIGELIQMDQLTQELAQRMELEYQEVVVAAKRVPREDRSIVWNSRLPEWLPKLRF
jgi:hypothetical protein